MQPKLKWQKHKGKIWTVPQFPFFTLVVKQCWNYNDRFIFESNSYPWVYERYPQTYKTLQEAMVACEQSMLKSIIRMQKEPSYTVLKHTTWCNNTGNGKYLEKIKGDSNRFKYQDYQWLRGGHNVVSKVSNQPAIRFDITTPEERIIAHSIKIHKRHCQRYIKAMQS